jgi:hypothetical protein
MSTPEGRVKAKVTKALKSLPHIWRFMPVQNGMGSPALDYINCINGYFVAIETKVPGKQLTPRQKLTACAICEANGAVYVIRDQNDINFMVGDLRRGWFVRGAIYDPLWDGSQPEEDDAR